MDRRELLKLMAAGTAAGAPLLSAALPMPARAQAATRGLPPVKIRDVRVILTAPNGIRLVVVKVETSEPGLYGIGCATFTQRAKVVATAVQEYLRPFLIGKDVDQIEDIWQSSFVSSYWRNGPVLNNAISGVDIALWDIKGKRANMPVYQLLGGKCRESADLYAHASGRDAQEVTERARQYMEQGYRHVRVQLAVPKAKHDYISTTEAGEILGISRQRVLKLVQQGRLKAIKVANVYLIKKHDLADVKDRKPGRPTKRKRTGK